MNYNWIDVWKNNNIAFHLHIVNPLLEKFWSKLAIEKGSAVFVPLCGKSLDLLWLANSGYHVIGAELSEIACEAFFSENKIDFKTEKVDGFKRYYNAQIEIYCGDFFKLSAKMLPSIAAVYDRGALIALPVELRESYAKQLSQLMAQDSQMLLIVLDSVDVVQGPPFPLSFAEIERLYGNDFQINEITRSITTDISKHLCEKGYREITDIICQLKMKTTKREKENY